jgi:3-hydroxybutyryl-CoA dehydrogenase
LDADIPVERVAVLGAGTMGHGIAHASASSGFETILFDISAEALDRARSAIERILSRSIESGTLDPAQHAAVMARLRTTTDLATAVVRADLVIEAVPERIDLKIEVLRGIERAAPSTTILASNTSALSITEMAASLANPGRLAGMHFFNPVHRMRLVEVVRALESADGTLALIDAVAKKMGKETVLVRESPGFVTSRINAMIGNEAFYMLQEGVASARDIDKALKLGLNHPMGPFEMVDLVGLDTRLSVLEFLHRTLGEKFRPCPLLVEYVQAGRLGRKAGRGVYDYRQVEK